MLILNTNQYSLSVQQLRQSSGFFLVACLCFGNHNDEIVEKRSLTFFLFGLGNIYTIAFQNVID